MEYNFNEIVDRKDNYSAKHDELEKKFGRADLISLWIADMDLKTATPIIEAIENRNKQGIYGYTSKPESYNKSISNWQQTRNGWTIDTKMMSFSLGVVPTLCTIVKEFSNVGDKVLFFTPVYSEFFNVVEDWGRKTLTCLLNEEDGYYTIDFEAFEQKLKEKPALLIFCSPHNPVGRVWTKDELKKVGDLCLKYGVLVISDEIHSDLVIFGNKHIPFVCISPEIAQNTITCISATKTFNLAGLQASSVIFPTIQMKQKFDAFWNHLDIHRNNCFSLVAVEAAFTHGADWLEQLLRHIEKNMEYVQSFLQENIKEITVKLPESTYLLWLDCRSLKMTDSQLKDFMVNEAKLGLNNGASFGEGGDGYMRLNVACPISVLEKAMKQLKEAVLNKNLAQI